MTTLFQQHVAKWENCRRCPLHSGRHRVVIFRGRIPCDVLMVGEAPGSGEDILGEPFVGPAGKLLDRIIGDAIASAESANPEFCPEVLRWGFGNVVGCFPAEAKATGNHAPPIEAIKACSPKVQELIGICRPKMIVCVGELAKKWIHLSADTAGDKIKFAAIIHPAAIFRMTHAQKGLAVQRCVVVLKTALEELLA